VVWQDLVCPLSASGGFSQQVQVQVSLTGTASQYLATTIQARQGLKGAELAGYSMITSVVNPW
jgi:hypothetical protein